MLWEKGQDEPAVQEPTLKNLHGTCDKSLAEELRGCEGPLGEASKAERRTFGSTLGLGPLVPSFPILLAILLAVEVAGGLVIAILIQDGHDGRRRQRKKK